MATRRVVGGAHHDGLHISGSAPPRRNGNVKLVDSARSDRFNEAVLRRMHRQRRKGAARPVSTPLFDSVKRLEQRVSEKLIGKFRRVQDAFRKFDRNGDGHISRAEFRDGLRALGFKVTEDQLSQLVKVLDHDGNGVVDYREFSKHIAEVLKPSEKGLMIHRNLAQKPGAAGDDTGPLMASILTTHIAQTAVEDINRVARVFKRYDAYGKGYITPLDFRAALRDCGVTLSDGQAARLMPVYDRNRDQRVQYTEFVEALAHGIKRQIAERDEADRHLQLGNLFSAPAPSPARQPSPATEVQQPPLNLNGVRPGGGSVRGHARSSRSRGKVGSGSMRGSHNREHGGHSVKHVEKLFADRLFSKFSKVQNAFRTFDEDKSGSVSASEFRLALAALGFDMTDAEFAKLIDKYDANGDGMVSYLEFNSNIGRVLRGEVSENKGGGGVGADHVRNERTSLMRKAYKDAADRRKSNVSGGVSPAAGGRDNALANWVELRFAKDVLKGLKDTEEAFAKMDTNCDGVLSKQEFQAGVRAAGHKLPKAQMEELTALFDRDGKGHITLADFKQRFAKHIPRAPGMGPRGKDELRRAQQRYRDTGGPTAALNTDERIDHKFAKSLLRNFGEVQNVFRVLDPGRTGYVSHKEFRKAMAMFGCPITDKDYPSFAAVYDPRGTGRICYTAFNKNIARLLQPRGGGVVVSDEVGRQGPHDKKLARARGFASGLERRFAQSAIGDVQKFVDMCMRYDKSGKHRIRSSDFMSLLKQAGPRFSKAERRRIASRFDVNADGYVDIREFTDFFTALVANPAAVTRIGHHGAVALETLPGHGHGRGVAAVRQSSPASPSPAGRGTARASAKASGRAWGSGGGSGRLSQRIPTPYYPNGAVPHTNGTSPASQRPHSRMSARSRRSGTSDMGAAAFSPPPEVADDVPHSERWANQSPALSSPGFRPALASRGAGSVVRPKSSHSLRRSNSRAQTNRSSAHRGSLSRSRSERVVAPQGAVEGSRQNAGAAAARNGGTSEFGWAHDAAETVLHQRAGHRSSVASDFLGRYSRLMP